MQQLYQLYIGDQPVGEPLDKAELERRRERNKHLFSNRITIRPVDERPQLTVIRGGRK